MTNHLDQCVERQYLLNITSLSPALFSDDNNIGSADNTNSYINSVININKIIDHLLKETMKMKEIKPTLNKGLKPFKELQLF